MTEVDDDMVALHDHVSAPVALPGERVHERAMPWNVAVSVQPAAVVLASTASDVAEVMRFASDRGLRVVVQATGTVPCRSAPTSSWCSPPG
jgi:FAD/FMN-containing dehydrogenase